MEKESKDTGSSENDKINKEKIIQLELENKILKSNFQKVEKKIQDQLIKYNDLISQHTVVKRKSDEYKTQLESLQKTIDILRYESKELHLKNAEFEEKLKVYKDQENELADGLNALKENQQKIYELSVLLKESRKQNLNYSDQIKDLKKEESNIQKLTEEVSYLQQENITLKAYIVSQNKMSHYGNAFKNVQIEKYCLSCSNSLLQLTHKFNLGNIDEETSKKETLVPETNGSSKTDYKATLETLRNSTLYTINVNDKEVSQKKIKESTQTTTPLPKINKQLLKQIMDKCDLSIDAINAIVRTIFHLGDQVEVLIDSDFGTTKVKATVKYIGNLDDRYNNSLFLGVKLHDYGVGFSDSYCNGSFRKKRFFNIDSSKGYFLHFSNVISVYNKETLQFEEFGNLLSQVMNPSIRKRVKQIF